MPTSNNSRNNDITEAIIETDVLHALYPGFPNRV